LTNVPPQRVSPIPSPDAYVLPARPENAPAAVLDAYRQTQFLLGGDLSLFTEAMGLQIALVKDSYPSRYRSHALAAITGLWSRAFFYLSDALLLTTRGSYASTLPLVRASCEVIAAEEALRGGQADEYAKWLLSTLQPNETFKAFEFELGHFFAGEVLAADPVLRAVYRPASDLGRPHFGATLLQVAPESNNLRLAISFADASFHLGWGEIILGWLLSLAVRQVKVIVDAEPVFPIAPERRAAYDDLQHRIDAALARSDRCRVEVVEDGNNRRYLISNFRRSSGAAAKKIIL
jgi:hypothetical protein